jgi:WD40 repeat protein
MHLLDAKSGLLERRLEGAAFLKGSPVFTPDDRTLLCAGGQGVRAWEAASGERLNTIAERWQVLQIALSLDGNQLLTMGIGPDRTAGRVWLWDMRSLDTIRSFEPPDDPVHTVFSNDGKRFFGAFDHQVQEWSTIAGTTLRTLSPDYGSFRSRPVVEEFAMTSDERELITTTSLGEVSVWDMSTNSIVATLQRGPVYHLAPSADGSSLLTATNAWLRILDAATGEDLTVRSRAPGLYRVVRSPNGDRLAGFYDEFELYVLDLAGLNETAVISSGDDVFRLECAWHPSRPLLAIPLLTSTAIALFDATTGAEIRRIDLDTIAQRVAFSPDGTMLMVRTNRRVHAFETENWSEAFAVPMRRPVSARAQSPAGPHGPFTFSPDGRTFLFGSGDPLVSILDMATRTVREEAVDSLVYDAQFSPDGSRLYFALEGPKVVVRSFPSMAFVRRLGDYPQVVRDLVVSRTDGALYGICVDGSVLAYDVVKIVSAPGESIDLPTQLDLSELSGDRSNAR